MHVAQILRRKSGGAKYADSVESIMTGGDFALGRSVEFFRGLRRLRPPSGTRRRMGEKDM
jgi:hypothetical protein